MSPQLAALVFHHKQSRFTEGAILQKMESTRARAVFLLGKRMLSLTFSSFGGTKPPAIIAGLGKSVLGESSFIRVAPIS